MATVAVLALFGGPSAASAATITVETAFDETDTDPNCSLREAVNAANQNGGDANPGCEDGQATLDTIVFSGQPFAGLNGSGEDLNATGDLDIPAGGPGGPLRIDGSGLVAPRQIFSVGTPPCPCTPDSNVIGLQSGVLTVANVELVGGNVGSGLGGVISGGGTLTLENAEVSGGTGLSGGIHMGSGDMTLVNSIVSGNTGTGGAAAGGINYTGSGTVTLTNSVVSDNHATNSGGGGGGINYAGTGSLVVTNSTVTGNDTTGTGGGGIRAGFSFGVNATITGSRIVDNDTTHSGGQGGGVSYFGDPGENLRVIDSEVSANSAAGMGISGGGGIKVLDGQAAVVNSTLSGNMATAGSGGGLSSGIGAAAATVSLISSTVAGNTAMSGSGLHSFNGTLTLRNSIVANGAGACFEDVGFGGSLATGGFNVDEGTSCDLNPAMGDAEGVSAGLGGLSANGGPTLTHAIGTGSPAVDRVPVGSCTNDLAAALTADQRGTGFPRPVGSACDSGAFEVQPPPTVVGPGLQPGTATPAPSSPRKKCKKKRKRGQRADASAKRKRCKKKRRK